MNSMRQKSSEPIMSINFWPSYTDVCFIMILILILLVFVQIISNTEVFKLQKMRDKQIKIEKLIRQSIGSDALEDIKFSARFEIQRIQFSNRVLFSKNSADLQEHGMTLLDLVGGVLREHDNLYREIRIEGHTDKDPIVSVGGKYPSNWELSSARATAVVKYFDERVGIKPDNGRLSAVGFSKFVPIDLGDTDEAKAKNRRIEMAIYYDAN